MDQDQVCRRKLFSSTLGILSFDVHLKLYNWINRVGVWIYECGLEIKNGELLDI